MTERAVKHIKSTDIERLNILIHRLENCFGFKSGFIELLASPYHSIDSEFIVKYCIEWCLLRHHSSLIISWIGMQIHLQTFNLARFVNI